MQRRLELAKGLLHHPAVLLLDEPTTGLDPGARRDLWQYLQILRDEERCHVLVTTHLMEEAERCDRLAILNEGKLVALGTPTELKQEIGGDVILLDATECRIAGGKNSRRASHLVHKFLQARFAWNVRMATALSPMWSKLSPARFKLFRSASHRWKMSLSIAPGTNSGRKTKLSSAGLRPAVERVTPHERLKISMYEACGRARRVTPAGQPARRRRYEGLIDDASSFGYPRPCAPGRHRHASP